MENLKRVLFVTHVGNPGGAEFVMFQLCKSCGGDILHFQNGSISEIARREGIESDVLPLPDGIVGIKKESNLKTALSLIPQILKFSFSFANRMSKYDLIICMSQKSLVFAAIGKIISGKKIIWFMNDLISPESFNSKLIKISAFLSRHFAEKIVVNSKASYDSWIAAGGCKKITSIIYPGVDIEKIDAQSNDRESIESYKKQFSPEGKPLIGIIGRLSEWKGQKVFLKALAQIPEANGVIVGGSLFGEEKYEQELKELAKQLNLTDRVTFTGHSNDVAKIMNACDIIAHCSITPEPFGLSVVEAMLCSKPVIATDAGGVKEIIENNISGQLVPMNDPDALADAIKKYIENPESMASFAKNARKRGEYFSSKETIEKFKFLVSNT